MTRILLFDLGGVLIDNQMFPDLQSMMDDPEDIPRLKHRWVRSPAVSQFEAGRITFDSFFDKLREEFGLTLSHDDFLTRFRTWPSGYFDGALDLLDALRPNHTLCCLSNSNEIHWQGEFTEPFTHVFSSHLIGHFKPEPGAFDHVIRELDCAAEDISFFDDADINVEAAKNLRLKAYHTPDFPTLQQTLRNIGLL